MTRPTSLSRALLALETAIVASLLSGAVIGLLARLAMLVLTLAGGRSDRFAPLDITVVGTLRILLGPMLFGVPITLLIVFLWPRLPGSARNKALAAGLMTFLLGLPLLTDSSFKLNQVNLILGLVLFAALHFSFGWLAGLVIERWHQAPAQRRWLAVTGGNWRWLVWAVVLVGLGLLYDWSHEVAFG